MSRRASSRRAMVALALLFALAGCDDPAPATAPSPSAPRDQAILAVKATLAGELDTLVAASEALQQAAPAHRWSDAERAELRRRWVRTRASYERIEGAIATLFPHLDRSADDRYEGFVERARDADPFDGEGATGMHAIERILWAGAHPPEVRAFEERLRYYDPPRAPATDAEARAFRDGLLARLVRDVTRMRDDFAPLALDPAAAYRGVLGSIEEQLEKIDRAGTGEAESRYARRTLADMRANLRGGRAIVEALRPWLEAAPGGPAIRERIGAGLDRLEALYDHTPGDALPPPPEGWPRRVAPSPEQRATPYGQLWAGVRAEASPDDPTSLVSAMVDGARALGIAVRPRSPVEREPAPAP